MPASGSGFRLWQDTRRVAVLGTANSGKTVFLTSLIDRLLRRDGTTSGSLFGSSTTRIRPVDSEPEIARFPYAYYREDCLRTQRWPDKSIGSSQFRLRHTRDGAGLSRHVVQQIARDLTLVDIPGERVADFSMAGRSFAEWSDEMLATLESGPYAPYSAGYFELLNADPADITERELLRSYKRTLARLARQLVPMVAPSTFLVHEDGTYPARTEDPVHLQSVEQLVAHRITGIDANSQFVPLPAALRDRHTSLARKFERHFDRYRDQLANPVGAGFLHADQMIILVDIAAVLEGGPEVYHGTRKVLQLALEFLDPGTPRGGRLHDLTMRLLTGGRRGATGIKEITLVAAKADCVHRLDRPNLCPLLEQMTADLVEPAVRDRGLRATYLECAAIEATESMDDYPFMSGYVIMDADPDTPRRARFSVSEVPAEWPAESVWRNEAFAYASPEPPRLDLLGRDPFPGINMDGIAKLIGWKDP